MTFVRIFKTVATKIASNLVSIPTRVISHVVEMFVDVTSKLNREMFGYEKLKLKLSPFSKKWVDFLNENY
jgi:hypothetical protein